MNPLMNPVGSKAEGKLNCINAVVITHSNCLIYLPDKSGNFNTYSQELFNKSIESKKKRPQSSKTGCCEASFSCF